MTEIYQKLFEVVEKTIAHPHKTITEHDGERASTVLLTFASFLADHVPGGGDHSAGITCFVEGEVEETSENCADQSKVCYNTGVSPGEP